MNIIDEQLSELEKIVLVEKLLNCRYWGYIRGIRIIKGIKDIDELYKSAEIKLKKGYSSSLRKFGNENTEYLSDDNIPPTSEDYIEIEDKYKSILGTGDIRMRKNITNDIITNAWKAVHHIFDFISYNNGTEENYSDPDWRANNFSISYPVQISDKPHIAYYNRLMDLMEEQLDELQIFILIERYLKGNECKKIESTLKEKNINVNVEDIFFDATCILCEGLTQLTVNDKRPRVRGVYNKKYIEENIEEK
jgi:hypothetical protein